MASKYNEKDCLENVLKTKALVYGWYGKGVRNIGDALFCKAFQNIFPNVQFTFTDYFKIEEILANDIIIFGGGSFLYSAINGQSGFLDILQNKKIFYIGVGIEANIHDMHRHLMINSSLIAHRTPGAEKILPGVSNTFEMPDLVHSLADCANLSVSDNKSILVLPNAEVLPKRDDPHYKYAAWGYFKSEFSQFLDVLKDQGYKINFAPMCSMAAIHDLSAAIEIINQMKYRDFNSQLFDLPGDFGSLTNLLSKYQVIISQRYHGTVLSRICRRPCITIAHHDKLRKVDEVSTSISYYEISKQKLLDTFNDVKKKNILPIKLDRFEELRARVSSLIGAECQNSSAPKMVEFK